MTEFEKEIALIEKTDLKTSPQRLEYEKKVRDCGVCQRSLRKKVIPKIR